MDILAVWEQTNVQLSYKVTGQIQDLDVRLQDIQKHVSYIHHDVQWTKIYGHLSEITAKVQRLSKVHTILATLRYEYMDLREEWIKDAHIRTFDWVYQPPSSHTSDPQSHIDYVNWLQHGEGIYWITGKPGELMPVVIATLHLRYVQVLASLH
jgi:hypothetical protein